MPSNTVVISQKMQSRLMSTVQQLLLIGGKTLLDTIESYLPKEMVNQNDYSAGMAVIGLIAGGLLGGTAGGLGGNKWGQKLRNSDLNNPTSWVPILTAGGIFAGAAVTAVIGFYLGKQIGKTMLKVAINANNIAQETIKLGQQLNNNGANTLTLDLKEEGKELQKLVNSNICNENKVFFNENGENELDKVLQTVDTNSAKNELIKIEKTLLVTDEDLLKFSKENNTEEVLKALDNGAGLSVSDNNSTSSGWNALHWLAYHGNDKAIDKMLDVLKLKNDTTSINKKTNAPYFFSSNGEHTPLILAGLYKGKNPNGDYGKVASLLINKGGADISIKNAYKQTYSYYQK